jgi:hypothetical protein
MSPTMMLQPSHGASPQVGWYSCAMSMFDSVQGSDSRQLLSSCSQSLLTEPYHAAA